MLIYLILGLENDEIVFPVKYDTFECSITSK